MAIGYICPCCGEKFSRDQVVTAPPGGAAPGAGGDNNNNTNVFVCLPCGGKEGAQSKVPLSLPDMSVHTIPLDTPVVELEASKAFTMLTSKEQEYAYHLGKADWEGAKINLLQCSIESTPIFCLLQLVFSAQPMNELLQTAAAKAAASIGPT